MQGEASHTLSSKKFVYFLALCIILLIGVLLSPSILVLMVISIGIYGFLLWKKSDELKKLKHTISVALVFILFGALPLLLERVDANSQAYISYWKWGITPSSLQTALLVGSRCFASFSVLLVIMIYVPIYSLATQMRSIGIPTLFVDLFELVYRYTHVLSETADRVRTAQIARLGYGSWHNKVQHSAQLVGQTLVLAYDEADKMYNGLLSRGFDEQLGNLTDKTTPNYDPSAPIIRLEKIYCGYNRSKTILKNLDLSINKGQKLVILGSNGAGKSTLFLLLGGILKPTIGSFQLGETKLDLSSASLALLRREVALVFQNSNHQLFTPTVEDEIAFGLKNIGMHGDELRERVERQLEQFGLKDKRHTPPHQLSDGQKKWVAMAAVLATDPSIIILDEPTSNLDCYYSRKVIELTEDLSNRGKTVILSTHDMDLAFDWADRAVVIQKGEILGDGTPLEIFSDTELLQKAHLNRPRLLQTRNSKQIDSILPSTNSHPTTIPLRRLPETKAYFPLFLHSKAIRALVVGGGRGAAIKAFSLSNSGVQTTLIAPQNEESIQKLSRVDLLNIEKREFKAGDTTGYQLVVAATGSLSKDREICSEAASHSALYALLSDPQNSLCQFAATGRKNGVEVAVHSTYRLPRLSVILRDKFMSSLPSFSEQDLAELKRLREDWVENRTSHPSKATLYEQAYDNRLKRLLDNATP